jgi:hypothetical protein
MAERTFREHRRDPAADLSPVLVGYAKVLEVQVNELLRRVMHDAPDAARRVKLGDTTRLLPAALPLTLGQIGYALGGEPALGEYLRKALQLGAWFTSDFAAFADGFAEARNPAAHGDTVLRETVVQWRNRLLGVGAEGIVGKLAAVTRK